MTSTSRRPSGRLALLLLSLTLLLAPGLAGCSMPSGLPFTGVSASANSVTIPAQIRHGDDGSALVVVEVEINGKGPYSFALDTGASLSLIDSDLAQQLRLPVAGPPVDIAGVGGKQRVTPVRVSVWALGAATLPEKVITSAALPDLRRSAGIVGLLGSDVLSTFSSVTIDYANSDVVVTSPPEATPSS
jgi:predicted aspartyl protease